MNQTKTVLHQLQGPGQRQILIAALASCLGWAFDLFDLFLILYIAPVIGRLFFPSSSPTLSLAAVYASFAVTLLMRPAGSALFGSYADRYGRKNTLIRTVIGVGLATALLGALPTIQQVGILAPILFITLRLIQGILVGGVVACTGTIGIETVPPRWRGLMSGLVGGGGGGIGGLFASVTFWAASTMFPGPAFNVWGWRVMFFSGILSALFGALIFQKLEESPLWEQLKSKKTRAVEDDAPLRTLFSKKYRRVFLTNLLITTGGGAGYYLTSGYMPTFLKVVNKLDSSSVSMILVAASVMSFLASVLTGHISELVGRRTVFLILGVARIILLPVLYLMMPLTQNTTIIGLYAVTLCFLGSAGYAPLLVFLNERFPTFLRASGTGLTWNIGFAIGGVLPAAVSFVAGSTSKLPMALSIFLVAISVLYLAGAVIVPETRGQLE